MSKNLIVSFQDCGEVNPPDPSSPDKIALCYEFLQQHLKIVGGEAPSTESFAAAATDTALLMFFQELGHRFIEQHQIPPPASEEKAADAFAAIMLSDLQGKATVTINTDHVKMNDADQEELQKRPFWKNHGINAQRYSDIACMIDSKFEAFSEPFNAKAPLQTQAQRCLKQDLDDRKSWDAMLSCLRRQTSKQGLETPRLLALLRAYTVARPQQITPQG